MANDGKNKQKPASSDPSLIVELKKQDARSAKVGRTLEIIQMKESNQPPDPDPKLRYFAKFNKKENEV